MAFRLNDEMRPSIAACLIVIAGALTYANSLSGPLLFDDQSAIISNPQIRRLWPPIEALAPPRDSVLTSRPFVNFSFAVNYALGGVSVRGYHLVNVSLHLLSALLLFGVVRRTLLTPKLRERFASSSGRWWAFSARGFSSPSRPLRASSPSCRRSARSGECTCRWRGLWSSR